MIRLYIKNQFSEKCFKNFRLARARVEKGLSEYCLAKKVGISNISYYFIEELRRFPNKEHREKIADVLGEDADYLFPKRFRKYCSERIKVSKDVFDNLERVKFNPRHFGEIEDSRDYEEMIEDKYRDEALREIVKRISGRAKVGETEVIELMFGLKDKRHYNLYEIGRIFNVFAQQIHYIKNRAIKKLQHPARMKQLEKFL